MPDIFSDQHQLAVPLSNELVRVTRLPRRRWTASEAVELAEKMTALLKTPRGTMELRPTQAVSLYELGTTGGLFGPQRVGAGKTLFTLLAPVVVEAKRPLLLVPAALVDKTRRDWRTLRVHWELPEFLQIWSYEWLGRVQAAEALEEFMPDLIVSDECHRLRNRDAAVTRRVRRYLAAHPTTKCAALSGTATKRSLHDYAHLVAWCLPAQRRPLPNKWSDLELWADALDERKGQMKRADPGALEALCNAEERELWAQGVEFRRIAARRAYRRRFVETAGIVATEESPIDASLTLRGVEHEPPAEVDVAFETLRGWETPDGWPVPDGLAMSRHARELAVGFFYVWSPRPPQHWLEARRIWCKFVRGVLSHSRKLDSELQVRRAFPDAPELLDWLAVRKDFEPRTEPRWIDDGALRFAAKWAEENRGIVWVEHVAAGERLEREFGLAYYGAQGRDARGKYVEDHPASEPLAASVATCAEGRNLQAWSSNLILSAPQNGKKWEQLLGRTHRDGQLADEVQCDVLVSCLEHVMALEQALRDAEFVQAISGSPQKLLLAGLDIPRAEDVVTRQGPRWQRRRY